MARRLDDDRMPTDTAMPDRAMRKKWREQLRRARGEGQSPAPISDPQHWRARAQEARAKGNRDTTTRATQRLRLLADTYDRVADGMEARLAQRRD
jgi:hypothetical protein